MKKFFSKKPVMIAFIIAAVIFLAVEIGILVRPVSYGLNYTWKEDNAVLSIKIHSDSVARLTTKEGDNEAVMDMWIYRDGNKILIIETKEYIEITGMTEAQIEEMNKDDCLPKDEYKKEVEDLEKLKEENKDAYKLRMAGAMEFGIFETKFDDEVLKCPQAIAFVVVHGVVTLALLAFAGYAVVLAVKKK